MQRRMQPGIAYPGPCINQSCSCMLCVLLGVFPQSPFLPSSFLYLSIPPNLYALESSFSPMGVKYKPRPALFSPAIVFDLHVRLIVTSGGHQIHTCFLIAEPRIRQCGMRIWHRNINYKPWLRLFIATFFLASNERKIEVVTQAQLTPDVKMLTPRLFFLSFILSGFVWRSPFSHQYFVYGAYVFRILFFLCSWFEHSVTFLVK